MAGKTYLVAIAVALGTAGCSSLLGLKDPTFDDPRPGPDAAVDAPVDTATDGGPAACVASACPFGCDPGTNACRPEKLWVYLTPGQRAGNNFGGLDTPPDVRATSDTLCFDTASNSFAMRACSRNRTHAILTINASDAIPLMATLYSIPTTVEVHRADDDVLVSNNWNDLTDTTKIPRAPVTTVGDGVIWTGVNGNSTCSNWTSAGSSKMPADLGVQGNATLMVSTWMVRSSGDCNLLEHLVCICFSGGQ